MITINRFYMTTMALLGAVLLCTSACKKEEEGEEEAPNINFVTATGYTSANATVAGGTEVKIGIIAAKKEEKDPLVKFNISKSVDGGANSTVYSQDLSGDDGSNFTYDFITTVGTTSGQTEKYTFTVTNRDGLNGQKTLTLTVQ